VNNLRADTNAPSNSISENKAKKLADDVHDVTERVADNEKLVEKIAGEITVLRAEINSLEGRLNK
jgi:cell division protein FtsB